MAEYDGDGVWDYDSDHYGPVALDALGVSAELVQRLKEWSHRYQATALTDFEFPSPDDERHWINQGLGLAYDLQNALPDIDISYAHDADNRPVRERRGP
ncbi:hypothetical protein M1L60_01660 [Actinoplanes sp. TRM 88003]|uniref:Uncharacterized protein n=1 Tax=Paractinoplanes aksuensis TaxID=2939490 RepID=A0ABT1DEP6_9ACTN|nr:hypothetical protein [Actinoplanes aksuensis]MCO8269292.1 hypothetical protein [Actinoplanes aksuensis]